MTTTWRLIRSLDDLVEAYPEVPNLCAIANPGGNKAQRGNTRPDVDLLAVRAHMWLAVTTAGRPMRMPPTSARGCHA